MYAQIQRSRLGKCSRYSRLHFGLFLRSRFVSTNSHRYPRIAQPSIWQSIIPRALRNRSEKTSDPNQKRSPNPATYFIWIYILIGSQAVRILQLQNDFNTFARKADLKIGKLREVVAALRRGEDVDVEKILGTGDETQEREWEEALKEIEDEDRIWQINRQKRREAKERAREAAAAEPNEDTASPVNDSVDQHVDANAEEEGQSGRDRRPSAPGFY